MQRRDRTLVVTTKEMREIARDTKRRGYNRNLTPAQFKLLDPRGTHILGIRLVHQHKDEQPCEPHMRMYAHIKLIGQHKAVERYIDIAMDYVLPYFEQEELFDPEDPEIKKFLQENASKLDELNKDSMPDRFRNINEVIGEIEEMQREDGTAPKEGTFVKLDDDGADTYERARQEVFDIGDALLEQEIKKRGEQEIVKRRGKKKQSVRATPRTTARGIVAKAKNKENK